MTFLSDIRSKSFYEVEKLGFQRNDSLPLLDGTKVVRSLDEILDRLLTMQCVAAAAYGFDREIATLWIKENLATDSLTPVEAKFLETGDGPKRDFMFQIEAIWALFWCCGMSSEMTFDKNCPNDFADRLPDIASSEGLPEFRSRAQVRDAQEIVMMADLAYCLHWAIVDRAIHGQTTGIAEYVVRERRHALDWLLTASAWNEISLDT